MMTRKVCALAEITIGQVPPALTPISATPHFKDFVLLAQTAKTQAFKTGDGWFAYNLVINDN